MATLSAPVAVSAMSRSLGFRAIVAPSMIALLASTASKPAMRAPTWSERVCSWITRPGSQRSSGPGAGARGSLEVTDLAPVQVEHCRRKLAGHSNATVRLADAAAPPRSGYDGICCFFLLHEMPDEHKRLRGGGAPG